MDEGRGKIGGFTLIEIYTVMAIMGVLISISGLTTRSRNENLTLSIQQEKLRSIFVRAKSLAVSSAAISGTQICGYGVHIEPNDPPGRQIFVFADVGSCEGVGAADGRYLPTDVKQSTSLDLFKEEAGIGFACLTDSGSTMPEPTFSSGQCGTDFVFIPPDPRVSVKNMSGGDLTGSVTVGVYSKRNPGKIRKVIINQAGLIDATKK